jgi:hypothetical protein
VNQRNGSATDLRPGYAPNQPVWCRRLAFTPRPVIYTNADLGQRRQVCRSFDLSDQRISTDRHPEPAHQAFAGTSSEGMPHRGDDLAGPLGLLCVWAQTFGRRSVKIRRWQPAFRQRQRPRCNRSITCLPCTGRSFRERQYRLWREREIDWQPGQTAES